MSEHIPAPPTETMEIGRPASGGGRKGALVAVSVVAAVAVIAGGTYAAVTLVGGSDDGAADVLPASTFAYAEVDLTNTSEALPTLLKLPSVRKSLSLKSSTDLREKLVTTGCPDLDWSKDVAPWLGERAAVGAVPGGSAPLPVVAVEVTDTDAADKGIKALVGCGGEKAGAAWRIHDGWAVIAQSAKDLSTITSAAAKSTLADDAAFQRWTGEVGERGFVTAYASPKALDGVADAIESGALDRVEAELGDGPLGAPPQLDNSKIADALRTAGKDFQGGAATARAVKSAFEIESAYHGSGDSPFEPKTLAATLPDDTAVALAVNPAADMLSRLTAGSGLENGLSIVPGLSVTDIEKVIGQSFALAIGSVDLADPTGTEVGLKVEGDAAGVKTSVEKIAAALGAGGVVGVDTDGDLAAVGLTPDYRKSLLADGGLGKSKKFQGVVGHADKANTILYVDFDRLDEVISEVAPDQAADFKALGQLGFSAYDDGRIVRTQTRLTFD